jgi:hypothetical protein
MTIRVFRMTKAHLEGLDSMPDLACIDCGVNTAPGCLNRSQSLRSANQLVVTLLLYRECLLRRSNSVALSNGELRKLGISRQTKYRALDELREAGAIAIEESNTRRLMRMNLLWFP